MVDTVREIGLKVLVPEDLVSQSNTEVVEKMVKIHANIA